MTQGHGHGLFTLTLCPPLMPFLPNAQRTLLFIIATLHNPIINKIVKMKINVYHILNINESLYTLYNAHSHSHRRTDGRTHVRKLIEEMKRTKRNRNSFIIGHRRRLAYKLQQMKNAHNNYDIQSTLSYKFQFLFR